MRIVQRPMSTRSQKDEDDNESSPPPPVPSVRGTPAHLRPAVVREQNRMAARRSRQKKKKEIRELFDQVQEQLAYINALEARVSALEAILRDHGFEVPTQFTLSVIDAINTARNIAEGQATASTGEEEPDNEQLFKEMLKVLDGIDSD